MKVMYAEPLGMPPRDALSAVRSLHPLIAQMRDSFAQKMNFMTHYGEPLDVPMVLFAAGERQGGSAAVAPDLGWREFAAAGLDLRVAAGTHDNLVREPHVNSLAQMLGEVLRDAVARESPATRGETTRRAVSVE